MRTTIRLDDELLAEAKAVAARTHRNLNDVIADAVRESLARVRQRQANPVSLSTFRGRGLQPGVDLDDSSALQDLMDKSE